jgi:hypothetical protein
MFIFMYTLFMSGADYMHVPKAHGRAWGHVAYSQVLSPKDMEGSWVKRWDLFACAWLRGHYDKLQISCVMFLFRLSNNLFHHFFLPIPAQGVQEVLHAITF